MPSTTKDLIESLVQRYSETRAEIQYTSAGRKDAWKEKLTAKAYGMEDAFGLLFPDLPPLREIAADPVLRKEIQ